MHKETKPEHVLPTIDKGIPIPKSRRGNRKYPWHLMEVGDSFWVKASPRTVSQAGTNHTRENNNGREYRCYPEEKDGVKGTRCWRAK